MFVTRRFVFVGVGFVMISTALTTEAVRLGEQSIVLQPTLETASFRATYNPNLGDFAWVLEIPNVEGDVTATFHAAATETQAAPVIPVR